MNGYKKYNDIDLLLNEDKDVLDTIGEVGKGLIVAILVRFALKIFIYDKINKAIKIRTDKMMKGKELNKWFKDQIASIYKKNPNLIKLDKKEFDNTPKMKLLRAYITQTNLKRIVKDVAAGLIYLALLGLLGAIFKFPGKRILIVPLIIYLSYLGFDTGRAYDYIGVDIDGEYVTMGVKIRKSCKIELTQVICYSKDKEGNYYSHALPDPPKSLYALKKEELKEIEEFYMNHIKKHNGKFVIDNEFIEGLEDL